MPNITLSGEIRTGLKIEAIDVFYTNAVGVNTEQVSQTRLSIPLVSPTHVYPRGNVEDEFNGPHIIANDPWFDPVVVIQGDMLNGMTAVGPFPTSDIAMDYIRDWVGGVNWEVAVAPKPEVQSKVKPMHPDTILENPDFFEGATIVVPHFIGSDNEIPIPVFARLKIEGESVVYEGVCPDGETLVAGQLSQDDLARISIWNNDPSYIGQKVCPHILCGQDEWAEVQVAVQCRHAIPGAKG